jgi:hypothetical protein
MVMAANEPNWRRYVIDEILTAASELGIEVKELSPEETVRVRSDLSERFGDNRHLLTFGNMRDKISVQSPDGWEGLGEFLAPTPHVLFYDGPGDLDRSSVLIEDGSRIPDLIAETFGFPFYVTDLNQTFVVGQTDDDYMVGAGRARDWVSSLPPWKPPEG